ncbi:MAG: hemerythrin domain-containing protein [Magnetospirillum sp. WYHS-4]
MRISELSDNLLTGIPEVDQQHSDLFDALNLLGELAAEGGDGPTVAMALANFRDHVERHFRWEEAFMHGQGSVRLDAHRTLHEILLAQFDEMVVEVTGLRSAFFVQALQRRFLPWLVEHIVNVDKRMADH